VISYRDHGTPSSQAADDAAVKAADAAYTPSLVAAEQQHQQDRGAAIASLRAACERPNV
jgi:hypothetical protein